MNRALDRFTTWAACMMGRNVAVALAIGGVLLWAAFGPVFSFSDQWQLVMNTSTNIIAFVTMFVLQNTQERTQKNQIRDAAAVQLKLDELIRVTDARNSLIAVEQKPDEDLEQIKQSFAPLVDDGGG